MATTDRASVVVLVRSTQLGHKGRALAAGRGESRRAVPRGGSFLSSTASKVFLGVSYGYLSLSCNVPDLLHVFGCCLRGTFLCSVRGLLLNTPCLYILHSSSTRATIFVLTSWPARGTHAIFSSTFGTWGTFGFAYISGFRASNVALYSVLDHYAIRTGRVY